MRGRSGGVDIDMMVEDLRFGLVGGMGFSSWWFGESIYKHVSMAHRQTEATYAIIQ